VADDAHGIGAGDNHVKIDLTGLDFLGQVFEADDVGAGRFGGIGVLALRDTATRTVLPVPCGITVEPRTCWSDLVASTPNSPTHPRIR